MVVKLTPVIIIEYPEENSKGLRAVFIDFAATVLNSKI